MNKVRRNVASLLICLIALSPLRTALAAHQVEPVYDIVIRNGRVLDGAGNPWILADVAIKNGRFARIGKVLDYVLVNGQVVIDHGRHTGARPGHVIYGPGRTANDGATSEAK